jgi:hypothetical protein
VFRELNKACEFVPKYRTGLPLRARLANPRDRGIVVVLLPRARIGLVLLAPVECVEMRPILQVTWPLGRSPCSLPAHTVSMHWPATPGGMPSGPGTEPSKRDRKPLHHCPCLSGHPALPPGSQAYARASIPDSHFGSCMYACTSTGSRLFRSKYFTKFHYEKEDFPSH